jgi:alpha-beta hydrolase superfamily lysophospholipase
MKSDTFTYKTDDGTNVFVYRWLPEKGKPKAAVQIAHGMAEHAARYERFAKELVKEGYAVYASDHRGHKMTAGNLENVGFFAKENGWRLVVEDIHQLTGIIKKENPGVPLFLFGHSMGSMLGRNYIFLYGKDIDGVIISGTSADPGLLGKIGLIIAKREKRKKGEKFRSELLTKLSFGEFNKPFKPNRTDFDWLSRDDAEVDKYVDDPYCGNVFTTSFFVDLIDGVNVIHDKKNIAKTPKDLPMFIFSGDKDPVGKNGKGIRAVHKLYEKAGLKDLKLKLYPDARHEMLNETNRDEVFKDIIQWLNDHV